MALLPRQEQIASILRRLHQIGLLCLAGASRDMSNTSFLTRSMRFTSIEHLTFDLIARSAVVSCLQGASTTDFIFRLFNSA